MRTIVFELNEFDKGWFICENDAFRDYPNRDNAWDNVLRHALYWPRGERGHVSSMRVTIEILKEETK